MTRSRIPKSEWMREYERELARKFAEHSAQKGRDWGHNGEWAFNVEASVRDALAKADRDVARALKRDPAAVRSTMSPSGAATHWVAPDWRAVYVFTESGIGDPFQHEHVYEAFQRAVEILDSDPSYRGQFTWSWDSINPAVHVFRMRPLESERHNPTDRDDTIAYVVLDAAARTQPWSPASSKRFISDVYATLRDLSRDDGMTIQEFKRELVRLHRAGKIRLARADLVAAMPGAKVRASESTDGVAEYHFIDLRDNPAGKRTYRIQKVVAKLEKAATPEIGKAGKLATNAEQLVQDVLADYLSDRATEAFLSIYLNVRNKIIGYTEYSSGSIASVEVDPSGIMRDALALGAIGVITVHNHPTGDPSPSREDLQLWLRLREAGKILGIPVVDNLIVGSDGRYYSEAAGQTGRVSLPREAP